MFGGGCVWKRGDVQTKASSCCVFCVAAALGNEEKKKAVVCSKQACTACVCPAARVLQGIKQTSLHSCQDMQAACSAPPAVEIFLNSLCRSGIALVHAYDWLTNV